MRLRSIIKNKRGASIDNFFVMISFFGLAIFFIALILFWNSVSGVTELWSAERGGQIQNNAQNAVDQFDYILMFMYFAMHLGILVTAFLLRTHPVVYVAAIFLTVVLAMVAAPLSNAYEDLQADSNIVTASADLPVTNYILSKLPMFEVAWAIVTMIVLFGMARYEGFV